MLTGLMMAATAVVAGAGAAREAPVTYWMMAAEAPDGSSILVAPTTIEGQGTTRLMWWRYDPPLSIGRQASTHHLSRFDCARHTGQDIIVNQYGGDGWPIAADKNVGPPLAAVLGGLSEGACRQGKPPAPRENVSYAMPPARTAHPQARWKGIEDTDDEVGSFIDIDHVEMAGDDRYAWKRTVYGRPKEMGLRTESYIHVDCARVTLDPITVNSYRRDGRLFDTVTSPDGPPNIPGGSGTMGEYLISEICALPEKGSAGAPEEAHQAGNL